MRGDVISSLPKTVRMLYTPLVGHPPYRLSLLSIGLVGRVEANSRSIISFLGDCWIRRLIGNNPYVASSEGMNLSLLCCCDRWGRSIVETTVFCLVGAKGVSKCCSLGPLS